MRSPFGNLPGWNTSNEVALRAEVERLRAEKARGWVGQHSTPHPEGTCLVCESEREAEDAQARLREVVEALKTWRDWYEGSYADATTWIEPPIRQTVAALAAAQPKEKK